MLQNSQWRWKAISFFLLALVSRSPECLGQLMLTRTETFDSDPGWDGHNNRTILTQEIRQDFRWNNTNATGGDDGEVGGTLSGAGEPAYFAKVLSELTLDDAFEASGILRVAAGQGGHALLGFFNNETINEWRTPNSLGLRIKSENNSFFYAYNDYATQLWRAGGVAFNKDGTPMGEQDEFEFANGTNIYNWSIAYDPTENGGGGSITSTMNTETVVTNLDAGHKADGSIFNRFGLLNVMKSADDPGRLWIDDVTINGVFHNFDSDPGWDGLNNHDNTYATTNVRPGFDFGYSSTNNVGAEGAGERGGGRFSAATHVCNSMAVAWPSMALSSIKRFPSMTRSTPQASFPLIAALRIAPS